MSEWQAGPARANKVLGSTHFCAISLFLRDADRNTLCGTEPSRHSHELQIRWQSVCQVHPRVPLKHVVEPLQIRNLHRGGHT